jgi:peptidoglycan/xylan/chitin deacetylase (PgdA/CDA1 family)
MAKGATRTGAGGKGGSGRGRGGGKARPAARTGAAAGRSRAAASRSRAKPASRARAPRAKKEILVAYGIDVDAVAGWLGSYGGQDSPCDITRGMFAGEVGSMRLLRLFKKWGIKTTWFIPGHSIETFPEQMQAVADAGHEIGMHGYSHENPVATTPEQEEAIFDKCIEVITKLAGKSPRGYVAPWWELGPNTAELLLRKGLKYDHSMMNNDFHPFYVRVGDSWTKIDYSQHPSAWMKPLVRGKETYLIDIPASWYLDDLPPMMFMKAAPNSHGFVNPRQLEQIWRDQFDWVYREYDYAVFTFTIHPDVCGKAQNLLMLERLYDHVSGHRGVQFATFEEIADDFARRYPRNQPGRPVS